MNAQISVDNLTTACYNAERNQAARCGFILEEAEKMYATWSAAGYAQDLIQHICDLRSDADLIEFSAADVGAGNHFKGVGQKSGALGMLVVLGIIDEVDSDDNRKGYRISSKQLAKLQEFVNTTKQETANNGNSDDTCHRRTRRRSPAARSREARIASDDGSGNRIVV
jgi:hypothetical protein